MPPITSTNQLTDYAIRVFTRAGWKCWRNNNGAVYSQARNSFIKNDRLLKGVPDIIGHSREGARFLAIEIKVGSDRLSPHQSKFLDELRASGGLALVVKHADDLIPYLT